MNQKKAKRLRKQFLKEFERSPNESKYNITGHVVQKDEWREYKKLFIGVRL